MQTIFISSTFQDMQQERDIIQSSVLPRIKELAKCYGETVELCDLRWGIDSSQMDESESTAKILQTCFDEIDASRPFFIALLGDRYGWVPDADLVQQILHTQGRSIPDFREKSVTELEILYGAFHHQHPQKTSRFYFRSITGAKRRLFVKPNIPAFYLSGTREDSQRMEQLKGRIASDYPKGVRDYSVSWNEARQELEGLEAFAEMVYEDLKQMLEQRFGVTKELTEFEKRRQQQRYALETDRYDARLVPKDLQMPQQYTDVLLSGSWPAGKQTLFLVSRQLRDINRLVASLCPRYKELGYQVVPYDCGQSLQDSTLSGLLSYLIDACSELALVRAEQDTGDIPPEERLSMQQKLLRRLLHLLDTQNKKVLFAVRNLHKLDEENLLAWLPVESWRNIRFLITTDSTPVGPEYFGQIAQVLYFQTGEIFDTSVWIDLYMSRYHKQPDDATKATLIKLAENQPQQYLEFLMQRLLLLDKDDFAAIKEKGGDIQAISDHLCQVLLREPDNLDDIARKMVMRLASKVGEDFTRGVLGMLLTAPYGLPRTVLQEVTGRYRIGYSHLAMSAFCRQMSSLVNETLDGYLRCVDSPAVELLRSGLITDVQRWSGRLEQYLADCLENPQTLQSGQLELLRNQYLQIALKAQVRGALKRYVNYFRKEPHPVATVLHRLLADPGAEKWLSREIEDLGQEELRFFSRRLYSECKANGWTDGKLFGLWKVLAGRATVLLQSSHCKINSEICFYLTYQCGEMAYLAGEEEAERYLLRAKRLSREDFARYPNRLWKTTHGIPLTQEEKEADREFLGEDFSGENGPMLAHETEVQDMIMEQSWSDLVRIINRYLSSIYRKTGDRAKAAQLEEETARLTHMLDPNPGGAKQVEMAPGITVIMPDSPDGESSSRPSYRPDHRRNTALQIGKEALDLKNRGEYEEALAKYQQCNEMLLQIREDAKVRKESADPAAPDDLDEGFEMIALECLRDLSLNYKGMLGCAIHLNRQAAVWEYIDRMLECGIAFDRERNNVQSKGDLEECYAVAASCCITEDVSDYEKCLEYCANYFRYREEAAAKGERVDEHVRKFRQNTEALLYHCVTNCPQLGDRTVDVLLEASNKSAMYQDFDGYCHYTRLLSDLLDWMWEKGYYWTGKQTTLENIYIHNITNLCGLWEKNNLADRLEHDALQLKRQLPFIQDENLKLQAAEAISAYGLHLFREGHYRDAAEIFGAIMESISQISSQVCLPVFYIQHQSRYVAALSEAGMHQASDREAADAEKRILEALAAPATQAPKQGGPSGEQIRRTLISELGSTYLNHAVCLSRLGENARAEQYLQRAEEWLREYPEVFGSNSALRSRVQLFRQNGLPKKKAVYDGEVIYRKLLDEAREMSVSCMKNPRSITPVQAEQIEHKLKAIEAVPEHPIFRDCPQMARLWHGLFQLYMVLQNKPKARQALLSAREYAQDETLYSLYGDIFSDLCALTADHGERMAYVERAICIFETLRKHGQPFSENSLAMAYHNRGLLRAGSGDLAAAQQDVETAIALWSELMRRQESEQTAHFLSEAKRLLAHIKQKRS